MNQIDGLCPERFKTSGSSNEEEDISFAAAIKLSNPYPYGFTLKLLKAEKIRIRGLTKFGSNLVWFSL